MQSSSQFKQQVIEEEMKDPWVQLPEWKRSADAGADVINTITDHELREIVAKKCNSIYATFRTFDKNNDGMVSRQEFFNGLEACALVLPKSQQDQIWAMIDEDKSGNVSYAEFKKKMQVLIVF